MTNLRRVLTILVAGVVSIGIAHSAYANGDACPIAASVGSEWLDTGTITKVDGPAFYMLGTDNQVYEVRAHNSRFIVNDNEGTAYIPTVGDNVRVFGTVAEGCKIEASRVRIFGGPGVPAAPGGGPVTVLPPAPITPERQVKIIIEKDPAPSVAPQTAVTLPPADWEGRGLIMDIDYTGRTIKVRTSTGQYTVHISQAQMLHGARRVKLGSLNSGDAVRVVGNTRAANEINAHTVYVTRTREEAQNALPQTPISIVGVIESVDYPSMTFTMQTGGPELVVLADKDTVLQVYTKPAVFADLKPGTRVKMSGYGNLANGYVARHIQIISTSP